MRGDPQGNRRSACKNRWNHNRKFFNEPLSVFAVDHREKENEIARASRGIEATAAKDICCPEIEASLREIIFDVLNELLSLGPRVICHVAFLLKLCSAVEKLRAWPQIELSARG
jgi:hypothetical protein